MSERSTDSVEAPDEDSADTPVEEQDVTDENSQETLSEEQIIEKRKRDTDEAIKRKQAEFTQLAQAVAELKGQISVLTGQKKDEEKDWLDDDEVKTELIAEPTAVVQLLKKMRGEFAQVLQARDRYWEEKMKANSPDLVAYREIIDELKQDPDYSGFSESQLAVIAKKMPREERDEVETIPPRPLGTRRVAIKKREEDIRNSEEFRRIYGDEFARKDK